MGSAESSFNNNSAEGPTVTTMASGIRNKMKTFWEQFDPTNKSMMLCSAANEELEGEDRVQVLKVCPPLQNKRVLEVGAGIGRFTRELAQVAKHVTAVDFMESYIDKNRELNGHFSNVDFMAADVTEMRLPTNGYDVIFTNWLLMYLSDEELEKVVLSMLSWLREGGYLFVRESCYKPSGDIKRDTNPTYYRTPLDYFTTLQKSIYTDISGQEFSFNCLRALSMDAYIRHYGNPFQLGFVLRKMPHAADAYDTFQAFLDANQYTEDGIRRYEYVFGKTFVSTGGETTTTEFLKTLDLQPGQHVLDVGCGLGGSAFQMARDYGVTVYGVDLSSNMIAIAVKYQAEMEEAVRKSVCFEMNDITKAEFEENKFDVIYSRDTILHISDQEALFAQFFKWLKPGGKLFITTYCQGSKTEHSEEFLKYVLQRGYHLISVEGYGDLMQSVGFTNVEAVNETKQFVDIMKMEMDRLEGQKEAFLERFSQTDYDHIKEGWQAKEKYCNGGDFVWGLLKAQKPE